MCRASQAPCWLSLLPGCKCSVRALFGNRFKIHDLVTKEIQSIAYRAVTVFGIKTGTRSSLSV